MKRSIKQEYLFAANLIKTDLEQPSSASGPVEKGLELDTTLALLKKNKVPLVFIEKAKKKLYPDFFSLPQVQDHYQNEMGIYTGFRDEWAKVRNEFQKAGIESMFIKSTGHFDYKSSNLDILIKEERRMEAESILKTLGYLQLHNVEEPFKTLFRKFVDGKSVSVIHLHNKVAWINPFHDEKQLWDRYQKSPEDDLVDVPSPEDSILILTAHWFYEDKEITLSDIWKVASYLRSDNLDWEYMKKLAQTMGWLKGLYFALLVQSFVEKGIYGQSMINQERLNKMEGDLPWWMRYYLRNYVYTRKIELPFRLPKIFGKSLHYLKTVQDKSTDLPKKIYELYTVTYASLFVVLFYNLKINIRYQPSMLISISGVDGSGKSTYGEALFDTVRFCELKSQYYWSRVGSSDFLKPFAKVAKYFYHLKRGKGGSEKKADFTQEAQRRKDLFGKSKLLRILGLNILLVEMVWQYFFQVAIPLLRKKVVICDRYIYDTFVDVVVRYGVEMDSPEGKWFAKMLEALTPKPDLAYILQISFEDACQRKQVAEEEYDFIKEQIRQYDKIIQKYNVHVFEPTEKTEISGINNQIITMVLTRFYDKWKR